MVAYPSAPQSPSIARHRRTVSATGDHRATNRRRLPVRSNFYADATRRIATHLDAEALAVALLAEATRCSTAPYSHLHPADAAVQRRHLPGVTSVKRASAARGHTAGGRRPGVVGAARHATGRRADPPAAGADARPWWSKSWSRSYLCGRFRRRLPATCVLRGLYRRPTGIAGRRRRETGVPYFSLAMLPGEGRALLTGTDLMVGLGPATQRLDISLKPA